MNFLHDSNISLNSKFDTFYHNVTFYMDNQVPLKKMNRNDRKFHSKLWINPKSKKLIKYWDKLLHRLNKKFWHNNECLYKSSEIEW